jgi:hypothetical protein
MAMQIKKAVRERVWLKIAAMGPAGAGKTYGTIGLAKGLAPTGKVLLVDTENSSASYYADKWDFDVVDMHAPFTSQKYMEVLQEAVRLGYEVIVIDSMSHEWAASGGVLDKKADFDRQKGERWGNWQDAKKPHALFKEEWLQAPIHVIATMRSKMEYVLETNEKGKQVPRKVGLAPIQDGDSEYEFGVAFEIDRDSHLATAAKDRTGLFDGRSFPLNETIGQELAAWLSSGAPMSSPAPSVSVAVSQPVVQVIEPNSVIVALMAELAAVTLQVRMPEKTRQALIDLWETDGLSDPDALRAEIATIRGTIPRETVSESFTASQRDALERKTPVSQAVSFFVDGIDPDPCIDAAQYEALGKMLQAYNVDRDCYRAYAAKAGHLLPCSNGPTLARLKTEEYTKTMDKLRSQKIAAKNETWSARFVRIVNATPLTIFAPVVAAESKP